jgi:hypothetical protein
MNGGPALSAQTDRLEALGYTVEQSQEVDDVPIWWIYGYDVSTYALDTDTDTLDSIIDTHEARVASPGDELGPPGEDAAG